MGKGREMASLARAALKMHYTQILFIVFLTLIVIVIYGNDLAILGNEALQNEAFNYVLMLPFLAGFLFYLKKDVIKASLTVAKQERQTNAKYINELLGVILCLIAFLVYWYGSYTFYPLEYHIMTLPLFLMGVTLFLSNPRVLRSLIFPILFLLFLIPIPTTVIYAAGGTMANFNTQIAYTVLKTAGLPLTLSYSYGAPTILLTTAAGQPASFSVDVACSGIYSLVAFVMFATFLAFVLSTSVPRKIVVFGVGFVSFAALNLVRIMTIFSVGYFFGEGTALIVHSVAGLILIFLGMVLVLLISEKLLKARIMTKPQELPTCPRCKTNQAKLTGFCQNCGRYLGRRNILSSKRTLAKLLVILIGCSVAVLSINAPTFVTARGQLGFLASSNTQNESAVFPEMPHYNLSFLYRDTAYEQVTDQDASLMYGYFPENSSKNIIYVDIGVASSIAKLHNWEVCLISIQTAYGQSPLVTVLDQRDVQLMDSPPLIGQYIVFDDPNNNYRQITLYWYEKAAFKIGLSVEQKYVRISLIILTTQSTNYTPLEQELLTAGQLVAAKWEPLKTQALFSLGVPAQLALLTASMSFFFVTATTQYLTIQRKKSANLKIFNHFASKKEKIVLENVLQLNKEMKHVKTKDIIENVQKHVGKPINPQTVITILKTLQKQGFIKETVVSVRNAPLLVWKV